MKKLTSIFTLAILALSFNASAEDDSVTDKLKVSLMNTPSQSGDKTFSYARWLYDDTSSSSIYFTYEKRTKNTQLSNRADSLLVSKTKDTTADFFPFEMRSASGDFFNIRGGIGFNITNNKLEEDGYFITSVANPFHPSVPETETRNHVFNNTTETTFYTGKIQVEFSLRFLDGNMFFENRSECIPVYYLMSSQTMKISPLTADGSVSNNYSGMSYPYIMNDLKIYLFKLIELQYVAEYQQLNYEQLAINYSGSAWHLGVQEENSYTIFNNTLILNLRPDLFKDLDIVLGFGKKFFSTRNNTTGETAVDANEWVYNIGLVSKSKY